MAKKKDKWAKVIKAAARVRRIQADFDEFDGDRRGIAEALERAKIKLWE